MVHQQSYSLVQKRAVQHDITILDRQLTIHFDKKQLWQFTIENKVRNSIYRRPDPKPKELAKCKEAGESRSDALASAVSISILGQQETQLQYGPVVS